AASTISWVATARRRRRRESGAGPVTGADAAPVVVVGGCSGMRPSLRQHSDGASKTFTAWTLNLTLSENSPSAKESDASFGALLPHVWVTLWRLGGRGASFGFGPAGGGGGRADLQR